MEELLARYKPTRLKFDIECSEYLVINPEMIRDAGIHTVVGEYHLRSLEFVEKANELYTKFEACGYEMNKKRPKSISGWGIVITSRLPRACW